MRLQRARRDLWLNNNNNQNHLLNTNYGSGTIHNIFFNIHNYQLGCYVLFHLPQVFQMFLKMISLTMWCLLVKFELCLSHTVRRWLCFPHDSSVKNLPATQQTQERWVRSLGREDPLEEGMTTHSSVLAWEIPWTEKPGGLQSMGLHRVGHNGAHTHEGDLVHRWTRIKFLISLLSFINKEEELTMTLLQLILIL